MVYMQSIYIPAPIRDIFHYALRMKNPQGEREWMILIFGRSVCDLGIIS